MVNPKINKKGKTYCIDVFLKRKNVYSGYNPVRSGNPLGWSELMKLAKPCYKNPDYKILISYSNLVRIPNFVNQHSNGSTISLSNNVKIVLIGRD